MHSHSFKVFHYPIFSSLHMNSRFKRPYRFTYRYSKRLWWTTKLWTQKKSAYFVPIGMFVLAYLLELYISVKVMHWLKSTVLDEVEVQFLYHINRLLCNDRFDRFYPDLMNQVLTFKKITEYSHIHNHNDSCNIQSEKFH